VVDSEGFEPLFGYPWLDMAKTICKRLGSSFYLPKDTFDGVPISVREDLKSVAVLGQNWPEIIDVIDEKQYVIELVAVVKISQKPPRSLFGCSRKQPNVEDFIGMRVDSAVQPELLTIDADHPFVDRELIHSDRRDEL